MKIVKALLAALSLVSMLGAAEPKLAPVEPLPFPPGGAGQTVMSLDEIEAAAESLDAVVGSYPPRYPKGVDRAAVYAKWSAAVLALEAPGTGEDSERVLVLKARLYRQGHNLDVRECGDRAEGAIEAGLKKYPDSIPVNFQASYFYLQINPKFAPQGEKALVKLRQLLGTDQNWEVERGFVFAYLYQQKTKQLRKQVDHCLKIKPDDEMMLLMRKGLKSGNVRVMTD